MSASSRPPATREALDGAHERLASALFEKLSQTLRQALRRECLQVHSGAKPSPVPGENADHQRRVLFQSANSAEQPEADLAVDGVHHLGTIQRHQKDTVTDLGEHGVIHLGPSRMPPSTRMVSAFT